MPNKNLKFRAPSPTVYLNGVPWKKIKRHVPYGRILFANVHANGGRERFYHATKGWRTRSATL